MASPKFALLLVLTIAALVPLASAAEESCRDPLGSLLACHGFMFEGAPAASPACCDAYDAVFNDHMLCLCYTSPMASTAAPPAMTSTSPTPWRSPPAAAKSGRRSSSAVGSTWKGCRFLPTSRSFPRHQSPSPAPQSPSAGSPRASPVRSAIVDSSPPPPPTSRGGRDSSVQMALVFFTVAAGIVAAVA
ncbi:unnamed protein product [Alopecurus aequalis]